MARQAGFGTFSRGLECRVEMWQARLGEAQLGKAWHGKEGFMGP